MSSATVAIPAELDLLVVVGPLDVPAFIPMGHEEGTDRFLIRDAGRCAGLGHNLAGLRMHVRECPPKSAAVAGRCYSVGYSVGARRQSEWRAKTDSGRVPEG